MAGDSISQAFRPGRVFGLFLVGLLICCARAEPNLAVPPYVASHAPLVWLHSQDQYRPSDLLAHLRHTTPTLKRKPIGDLPELDLDNLGILNKFGLSTALSSNDDPLSHPEWLRGEAPDAAGKIHNSTPCVVILVERGPVDLDAFYFYFYSYNEGPNITQVMEPLDRLISGGKASEGMHFGNHVGDWEHNMVRFRNGEPIGIYYSQHVDGEAYDWADATPIVYSALGSHANYAESGTQIHNIALLDYCDEGQMWDPILSAYFYRFDPPSFKLTRLSPPDQESSSPPSSNLTSFFYFTGHWGDIQYPDSDPRQEHTPHFGLRRFQTGPTGPRMKHLVRKGLKPDQRRKISWKEWAVATYLNLYPHFLKGWRKWFSLAFIIIVLVGIILGIRYAVKKFGTFGGYRKLHAESIPLDDWRREEEAWDAEALLSSSDDDDEDEEYHL
ncbi:hypothetical protein QQX98_001018 [Neonectria punicea]|uniref:Vacuolar protein sorting-associated protein 62 n=1 Tax=Neonectria punicea TaxID=979145 RepID=A0ABR1HRR6_9HYPO